MDCCIVAFHQDLSPTTSMLAITMNAAPVDDDVLGEWLTTRLSYTVGPAVLVRSYQPTLSPPAETHPTMPPHHLGTLLICGHRWQPNSLKGLPTSLWQLTHNTTISIMCMIGPSMAYEEGGNPIQPGKYGCRSYNSRQ